MIVLMYHDVVADVDSSGFSGHAANHYKLSPEVFASHLSAGPSASERVLFTFDDGGRCAVDPCADLLEAGGVRGLFFVPSDYIGKQGFCSGEQLRELVARGHRIGSHSASHPIPISSLGEGELLSEWVRSRDCLESVLGEQVLDASVPGGFTSSTVESTAFRAGYRRLFTSEPTRRVRLLEGMRIYGRYSVTRNTRVATIERLLNGNGQPWLSQAAWWQTKKVLKSLGGAHWLWMRERYFSRASGRS